MSYDHLAFDRFWSVNVCDLLDDEWVLKLVLFLWAEKVLSGCTTEGRTGSSGRRRGCRWGRTWPWTTPASSGARPSTTDSASYKKASHLRALAPPAATICWNVIAGEALDSASGREEALNSPNPPSSSVVCVCMCPACRSICARKFCPLTKCYYY